MEYMTAQEAALRWGVSLRYVQRLVCEGRIPGVQKYGRSWMIPAGAEKPIDKRIAPKDAPAYAFLPAIDMPRGNADAALTGLTGGRLALAAADLAYRRGDAEPAKALWRGQDFAQEGMLPAAALATAAALSSADYALYCEVQRFLDRCAHETEDEAARALLSLPQTLAVVSMALPNMAPAWLTACDFSLFPLEMRPFLFYLFAMHARNTGDRAAQLATARTAVMFCERKSTFTWLDVNLHLLSASACCALGDMENARRYLLAAMALGLPCGLIMPFADNLGDFGGMMETCLESAFPQYRAPILARWDTSFKSWMRFHNAFSKANITTLLSPREYHVARLLASGETYAGAARRMNLSVGRIKNMASEIYAKLSIQKREELTRYIL